MILGTVKEPPRKKPPRRRRHSWNRSQSDEGFGPIRQVGIAYSVGLPMMVVGLMLLAIASSEGSTFLWILAGGVFVGGIVAAGSGRIT
jgi:hypothetical protein